MSGYILCQLPCAERPYYIEHIGTNIYSMEELCYYLYNNLYLLDETILNEQLCLWLRDELGLNKLYLKLEQFIGQELGIGWFLLPVFKEINYLNQAETMKLNEKLKMLEGQPEAVRLKMKGDTLVRHEKYVSAIKVYAETLKKAQDDPTGLQFAGGVYNNMGCAYANLFQMEEALDCFKQAYLNLHTGQALERYLYAVWLVCGKSVYEKELEAAKVDQATREKLEQEIRKAQQEQPGGDYEALAEQWTADYHRSTGM